MNAKKTWSCSQGRDLLLFLPGVSGVNFEAVDQFDLLSATFDVWSMEVRADDQSTFAELTEHVCACVRACVCANRVCPSSKLVPSSHLS